MDNEIFAGEVIPVNLGLPEVAVTGTATVTEVNVDEKTVTMSMDTGEQATETPVVQDPVEEAAEKFTKLMPFVSKIATASRSKGSLVRVLVALAEFPLGKGKPRLLNENEKLLFNIMQEAQGYKSTILQAFMKKNLAKMQEEKEKTDGETTLA